MRQIISFLILAFPFLTLTIPPNFAGEGMFLPNNLPVDAIESTYGFRASPQWAEHLRLSSVRLPNGSGSFASGMGLILTNHHVALGAIHRLSSPERDLVKNGFVASTLAEEIKIPNFTVRVLVKMSDVTERINKASSGKIGLDATRAIEREIARIEEESFSARGQPADVLPFFNGLRYDLYEYQIYNDIRLAFAPEMNAGFFGGDARNFEFPRHALDMTLLRVYENGKPLVTPHYLQWKWTGARENDVVITSGHPGSTNRFMTSSLIQKSRVYDVPNMIEVLEARHRAYKAYAAESGENERQAKDAIFSIENSLKVYRSRADFLNDPQFQDKQRDFEKRMAEKYPEANELLRALVAGEERIMAETFGPYHLASGLALDSTLVRHAIEIVRYSRQKNLALEQREPAYRPSRLEELRVRLGSTAPIYPAFERAKLRASLTWFLKHPKVTAALKARVAGGQSPEEIADAALKDTRLTDPHYRVSLLDNEDLSDPLIKWVVALEVVRDEAKLQLDTLLATVADAKAQWMKIRLTENPMAYPDATFTLRFSFGRIEGYADDSVSPLQPYIPPFTTASGLYLDAKANEGKSDWELPPRWKEAQGSLDLFTPFNFVSTNDIIGGNSGSPVVDTSGRLVGLAFDGNRYSTGDIFYRAPTEKARTLSVDIRVMALALDQVYGAHRILNEIRAASY